MRIAMLGSGGVGGYFGARLAAADNEVWFLARGAHLEAMLSEGLRISSPRGDVRLPHVSATDDAGDVGTVDLVLVAVKTWQLAAAAEPLSLLVGPHTSVVPLLNGVEAADVLADAVGRERILKGLCRIIAYLPGPGHVHHVGAEPTIVLGEWDNARTERVQRIRGVLAGAGIRAEVPEDIDAALWQKLVFVGSVGGVGAVARAPIGEIRSERHTRAMIEEAMREIVAVAASRGVRLPPDVVASSMSFVDTLPPGGSTSLQRDLAAGRRSELEAWTGAVVRLGEEAGVPTPVNATIYGSLVLHEKRAQGTKSFEVPGEKPDPFRGRFLEEVARRFRLLRALAEGALEQVSEEDFFRSDGAESNSIAVLVKHLAGNHRSRWTDFLTSDGEKPDRERDREFDVRSDTRSDLMEQWRAGWDLLQSSIGALEPGHLDHTVRIRGEPHSVEAALLRSLTHAASHVGQIVHLAKGYAGERWKTLSIPRGQSERYNAEYRARYTDVDSECAEERDAVSTGAKT